MSAAAVAAATVRDVLIIGGGPAGLSAAIALSRLVYTATVFDSGVYRNHLVHHMHTVPTWDHKDPADYRAAIRRDLLARYQTIDFEDVAVESVQKTDDGLFKLVDAKKKEWLGRKVILATGVKDIMPDIPGYEDCWTKGM